MLKKVFRQKDQSMFFVFWSVNFGRQHIVVAFARMLNEMRYGKLQESTIRIFKTLDRELIYTDGIQPTDMWAHPCVLQKRCWANLFPRFPTRKEVIYANARRLGELPGRPQIYQAQDQAGVDHREAPISHGLMVNILDQLVAPSRLELKVGAQVMLIKVLWMIRVWSGMKLISLRI